MDTSRRLGQSLVERFALPPAEIERRSLVLATAALEGQYADEDERRVAGRILYAAGDLALAGAIRIGPGAVTSGIAALRMGCTVIADVRMVVAGLDRARLDTLHCPLLCAIDSARAAYRAGVSGLPRAVEAMRELESSLAGAAVVIGNAPTALLALLDLIDAGAEPPALIVGIPVGFVAATEAKQALLERSVPYITVAGSRGGSPLAAAALNALARLATSAVTGGS
ncbi:MAG: precorrin-8X methylmutase [Dehalococcoidia bacterium]